MIRFPCPSCGADLTFKSKASIYVICPYCKSTAVRHDLKLENYGKMAELQEDLSPFMIGTKGLYMEQSFELIGRIRMAWENGFWNEWFALLPNGQEAWLAEANGFYIFSFPETSIELPPSNVLVLGQKKYTFNNISFQVYDIKQAICLGSEGELPFAAPLNRKTLSIDLSSSDGYHFANLEYELDENTNESRLYIGEYLDFDQFNFTNLREIEGWQYER